MTETKEVYTTESNQPGRRALASALLAFASWSGGRSDLARSLGNLSAYDDKRDYNEALGYIQNPSIDDYRDWHARSPYAKVAVDLPADFTWKEPPQISEDGNTDTPFVQAWDELAKTFRVWSVLARLDRAVGLGRYGVLVYGLRNAADETAAMPAKTGSRDGLRDLLFLRIAAEDNADITRWNANQQSRRFGMPDEYNVKVVSRDEATIQVATNWTRILHVAEEKSESEVYGTPRLENVLNAIMDEMKIGGGSAEATWLNMRPGTSLVPIDGFDIDYSDEELITQVERAIQEYAHDPLRIARLVGMEMKQIGTSEVVDPRGPHAVNLEAISTGTRIPQRVLVGSAQGELSAAQEDTRQWLAQIADRQELFAEPEVLRPFIDRLVGFGILPEPSSGEYDVGTLDENGEWKWPSLFELTDLELSEIAQNYASASRNLTDQLTFEAPNTQEEARIWLGLTPEKSEVEVSSLAANDGLSDYGLNIRAAVRGLWSGKQDLFNATESFALTIERGLRQAWIEGAAKVGVKEVELTQVELAKLSEIVNTEIGHAFDFLREVMANNKAAGKKLGPHIRRAAGWLNRYTEVANMGMLSAREDPKLKWIINEAKDNCISALKLNGKVKRASQWRAADIRPQSPKLECVSNARGVPVCGCRFEVTDEPLSRGRLPGLP